MNNVKKHIDDKLKNIKITEDIKENIMNKRKKNQLYYTKRVAVVALPLLLICILFTDDISATANRVLGYIPGINKLVTVDSEDKAYWLSGSILFGIDEENYIKVNSAYSEGKMISMTIEGNVPINELYKKGESIVIENEKGELAKLISSDLIGDSQDNYNWSGRLKCEFNSNDVDNFNILYGEHRLPIVMTSVPELASRERNFTSFGDIDIAIATNYIDNKLQLKMLTNSDELNQTISFPLSEIYLLDSKGTKYYSEDNSTDNTLYFNRKLEPNIKLVIPYIIIQDMNLKKKVHLDKKTEMPINLTIGDYKLTISNVEWLDYIDRVSSKTIDGKFNIMKKQAQRIKLVFDKNVVLTSGVRLESVIAAVDRNELNDYNVNSTRAIYKDPYEENKLKEVEKDYYEVIVSSIKSEQEAVNITLSDPIFSTKEEIIIPLQP